MNWLLDLAFGWVPWWAWALVALALLGGVWKWLGWQGVIAVGFGIAAFFGYRQGWKDKADGKEPIVPVTPLPTAPAPKTKKKKMRTVQDWLNGR